MEPQPSAKRFLEARSERSLGQTTSPASWLRVATRITKLPELGRSQRSCVDRKEVAYRVPAYVLSRILVTWEVTWRVTVRSAGTTPGLFPHTPPREWGDIEIGVDGEIRRHERVNNA